MDGMEALRPLTIHEALKRLRSREITAADLNSTCLAAIERLNPRLNAFITVNHADPAVESPGDMTVPTSLANALRGIPIAVKDLYDTQGMRTTAGSRFYAENFPDTDAFTVEMIKLAGGHVIGKTNTHEFAFGVTGVNPHYGAVRNPWDPDRITGGSSSGSAAAVAAGMALGALGSDTGGSIRIPASLCGVAGFKPTYGRVSTRGIFPLSWNLDHAGPLAACVKDLALIMQVISVYDHQDPATTRMLAGDFLGHLMDGIEGRRIALAVGTYVEAADPEILEAVWASARTFEAMGCRVEEVNVDWLEQAAAANRVMLQADAAAVHRERMKDHPDWFGDDVRERLESGARITSTEYVLARRTQTEIRKRFEIFFETQDLLILPTTPLAAPPIEGTDALEQARRLNRFTGPFNLAGLPALSIPCGFTAQGLPIGLQIVARAWADAKALNAGDAFEQATEWHTRRPDLQ